MNSLFLFLAQTVDPSPSASPTRLVIDPPPPSGVDVFVAVFAIFLAVAAAVFGYRIIRGGRGL